MTFCLKVYLQCLSYRQTTPSQTLHNAINFFTDIWYYIMASIDHAILEHLVLSQFLSAVVSCILSWDLKIQCRRYESLVLISRTTYSTILNLTLQGTFNKDIINNIFQKKFYCNVFCHHVKNSIYLKNRSFNIKLFMQVSEGYS